MDDDAGHVNYFEWLELRAAARPLQHAAPRTLPGRAPCGGAICPLLSCGAVWLLTTCCGVAYRSTDCTVADSRARLRGGCSPTRVRTVVPGAYPNARSSDPGVAVATLERRAASAVARTSRASMTSDSNPAMDCCSSAA